MQSLWTGLTWTFFDPSHPQFVHVVIECPIKSLVLLQWPLIKMQAKLLNSLISKIKPGRFTLQGQSDIYFFFHAKYVFTVHLCFLQVCNSIF